MLDTILGAFQNLFSLQVLLFINLGMAIGIIFGALPGLSATMGVCLFLPMTFTMEPVNAIIFLCSIYCGGIYGGSITAILINTPGSPAAATPLRCRVTPVRRWTRRWWLPRWRASSAP